MLGARGLHDYIDNSRPAITAHAQRQHKRLVGTVDIAVALNRLGAKGGEAIAGLLMRKIFSHNQEQFTDDNVIPTVAVIEEAQSVLGGKQSETSPFVEWVKEGRKYELGAILITQQPGSLAQVKQLTGFASAIRRRYCLPWQKQLALFPRYSLAHCRRAD